jgi:hypothetical protein
MVLHKLWDGPRHLVCAIGSSPTRCDLMAFLTDLRRDRRGDHAGLWGLFKRASEQGLVGETQFYHKLGDNLWEFIQGKARVLFFFDGNKLIVCTHGFLKKSNKTPQREIDLAARRRDEYLRLKASGHVGKMWEG